ncbi:hypothetical protein OG429_12990 [Streptomyces sp. NBC_00190]|uniref:hypothetical protein n=1 Tax=unclassified Streptomyces TaxID=2593676 RepID=UPI002E2B6FDB|nr:hypothetical protein [Streptomyces sp. NBC_00190]WSZ40184.1 hypothetical protein OG239_15995 [Streptomyces sp. NBC_00868]
MSAAEKKSLQCELTRDHFTAVATMHGTEGRRVTVTGQLSCPSIGFTLHLEKDDPGINPQPNELVLKVVEEKPDGVVPPVLTDTEVSGYFPVKPEVDTVVIRNLDITVPVKDE